MIKKIKISEPELITDEEEIRYLNEIMPLKCEISELEQKNYILQKKLDKAIELLIEYHMPCGIDNFNIKNSDYCSSNCSVDKEVFKKCWLRYIEQELEK